MLRFFIPLILIIGMVVIYNLYNPPRSAMELSVPVHTLKKLRFNDDDLSFMLSDNSSCNNHVGDHNYVVVFGNRMDRKIWNQPVALYLTWQEIFQITDQVYLCIQFKNEMEPVWKGKFNLMGMFNLYIMHKSFFCNKKNSFSKWECNGYESHQINNDDVSKLLMKYNGEPTPNKLLQQTPKSGAAEL